MSDAQIFDPENYLLEPHQSPGLQPVKPSFEVVETPPPIATRDSSLEPSEAEEEEGPGRNKRPREQEKPPQGGYVLVRQLGPNDPDTAKHAQRQYLGPASRAQEEDQQMTVDEDTQDARDNTQPNAGAPNSPGHNANHTANHTTNDIAVKLRPEEDSIAKSPALARFTIDRAYGDPSNTLPAMRMSPPRSSSKGFPEIKQTLPSLTTAIPDAGTPFSAHSPNLTRASPSQMCGPLPYSAMLPPSLPSHPSFWKTNTREGSISTPSDYAIVSASRSVSTPASSIVNQSPASHPTPTTTSQEARPDGSAEQVVSPESDSQETNEIGGSFSGNSYKCTIPGCTAAPFQTRYLVNSHMNVHSDTRPYFCPVKRCARGPSGQGFKRKNEMIRHGLVHTSPGYMCPFCPDQQHKYPRPDNLQRHVTVSHVDKDRDDPLLREVLAQRPEGGSRGRRRRLRS